MAEAGGGGEYTGRAQGQIVSTGDGSSSPRVTLTTTRSGPLPSPHEFEHYDAVLPGAAERILAMAEREQDFQHAIISRDAHAEHRSVLIGQASAFIIAMVFLAASVYLVVRGHSVPGTILGVTDLGVLVGLFLRRGEPPSDASGE